MTSPFNLKFGTQLEKSDRLEAFAKICDHLDGLGCPVIIVETGCVRQPNNWLGDGQSTLIWDWLVTRNGGLLTSIDIDESACQVAMSLTDNCRAIVGDAVEELAAIPYLEHVDFLYLDALDWTGAMESALHHAKELASSWDRLRAGCWIAVDDCFEPTRGKGQEIYRLLKGAGIEPIYTGKVTIWEKPDGAPTWKEIMDASATE